VIKEFGWIKHHQERTSRAYGHIQIKKMTNYPLTQEKLASSNKDKKRGRFDKTSSRTTMIKEF
jgi:hypothetical protein